MSTNKYIAAYRQRKAAERRGASNVERNSVVVERAADDLAADVKSAAPTPSQQGKPGKK